MKTTTFPTLTMGATIIMGWVLLTAQQCGDISGPTPIVQGCSVSYDSNFPTAGTISLDKPTNCPLQLVGSVDVPYAATVTLPIGSGIVYQQYQNIVTTWNGYNGGFVDYPVWSTGSDGGYIVSISGDYYAGAGGFKPDNTGYDDVKNGFYSIQAGNWTYATTRMQYSFGSPSNDIIAPDQPPPNLTYTASATTHDVWMVDPVNWSWYVDGQFIRTTSSPQTSLRAGIAYSVQTVQVTASDNYGNSASGTTTVQMSCGTSSCGK